MAIKNDFLLQEIFIKIFTKSLSVVRTIYLLFFFTISRTLDDFYFAKSIIGVVLLINILIEITYSNQIKKNRDNILFAKVFLRLINKISIISGLTLILLSYFYFNELNIIFHIIVLTIWGIVNVNSSFLILLLRYRNKNKKVLRYYFSIAILDFSFLFLLIYFFSINFQFLSISLSLLLSEVFVFFIIFRRFILKLINKNVEESFKLNLEKETLVKVFIILILVSLIEISDKLFLSFLGDGKITYYTFGLYAPLMIRQSLDIRSNFFVQINNSTSFDGLKKIFFSTIKKVSFFLVPGVFLLLSILNIYDSTIKSLFEINDIQLFKNIVYVGVVITPLYMLWDLFYRFYYRENKIKLLLLVVFFGLIINILLNYLLAFEYSLGIYGILFSTLGVFLFYNLFSYLYFFTNHLK